MLLSSKADGSISGRKPVEDSCFQVVVDAGNRQVHTEDGPVPLSDAEVEAAGWSCEAHQGPEEAGA